MAGKKKKVIKKKIIKKRIGKVTKKKKVFKKSVTKKKKTSFARKDEWPVWEVFLQYGRGKNHEHAGSLHAPDKKMALLNARDLYGRREKVQSIWVVLADHIMASSPSESGPFFDISFESPYRHPQFYQDL